MPLFSYFGVNLERLWPPKWRPKSYFGPKMSEVKPFWNAATPMFSQNGVLRSLRVDFGAPRGRFGRVRGRFFQDRASFWHMFLRFIYYFNRTPLANFIATWKNFQFPLPWKISCYVCKCLWAIVHAFVKQYLIQGKIRICKSTGKMAESQSRTILPLQIVWGIRFKLPMATKNNTSSLI